MRCEIYAYNQPVRYNQIPNFKAKPIKIDWNSDAGQILEGTLAWLAVMSVATVSYVKANPDKIDEEFQAELNSYKYANIDWNEEALLENNKSVLEAYYRSTNDPEIIEKHLLLLNYAYNHKNILRGGYSELTDSEILSNLLNESVINALGLFGLGTLKSALNLDLGGFTNFCEDISNFMLSVSKVNLEKLKIKINPQNTNKYRNLEEDVRKYKKQINRLLGKDNLEKRKSLQIQIEELKNNKENAKQIKELKAQIQILYKNCENSLLISELMKKITENQRKMKEILNQKVNMSPQEIINKVWTMAAISKSSHYETNVLEFPSEYVNEKIEKELSDLSIGKDQEGNLQVAREQLDELFGEEIKPYYRKKSRLLNKDISELIDLIQPSSDENYGEWNKILNKKLYGMAQIKYIQKFAEILDLADCKYLNELIVSDRDFWWTMSSLLCSLEVVYVEDRSQTISQILDNFAPNLSTKEEYNKRGIDYDAWVNYDENSYMQENVTISAKDAQKKAVKNMIFDLISLHLFIPKSENKKIFNKLKELGVYVKQKNHKVEIGIDGRGIMFSELAPIMSVIKEELNTNEFWSRENSNEEVEKYRDLLYCHFMLQRKQEIECAGRLKESEDYDVKVRKVNMADIKHSLCLGNHSHCCTALGSQSNEWSAPSYIIHRCISAIEVLANGEPVGNTMIYLAEVNGELSLILDDIELQTKFQNNDRIRDMVIDYAKQICSDIGKPDIPVYASPGMQKVDFSDAAMVKDAKMMIIGKTIEEFGVYLDFDNDSHIIGDIEEQTDLYRVA